MNETDPAAQRAAAEKLFIKLFSYEPDPEAKDAGDVWELEAIVQFYADAYRAGLARGREVADKCVRERTAQLANGLDAECAEWVQCKLTEAERISHEIAELDRLASEGT